MTDLPDGPLKDLYDRRVSNHQDLTILVTDWHNRRGTGKTVLSLKLADAMDRTDDGLSREKCTLSAERLTDAYTAQPKGSALVLDEAETGLSKYTANSATNRAMRQLVSMARIEEKYTILNAPASAEIDRDLKALVDVWIIVQRKGQCKCYAMKYNPHREHPIHDPLQTLEWSDLQRDDSLHNVYKFLTREKEKRLEGDDGKGFVEQSEAKEMVERAREEAEQRTRDELLANLYRDTDLTQQKLANAVGLTRSRVADIVS